MVGYFPWLAGFMAEKGQSPKTPQRICRAISETPVSRARPPHQGEISALMAFCSMEEFWVGVKPESGGGSLQATT